MPSIGLVVSNYAVIRSNTPKGSRIHGVIVNQVDMKPICIMD